MLQTKLAQALITLFLITLIALMILEPKREQPPSPEALAFAEKLQPIRLSKVIEHLQGERGRPKLLMVYATWCYNCRQMFPDIMALVKEGALGNIDPLFLSVDAKTDKLAVYLTKHGYTEGFTPYVLERKGLGSDRNIFKPLGLTFTGGIPYLAFLRGDGSLLAEFTGAIDKPTLASYIAQLQKPF